jgi:hypothetical protein
MIFYNSAVSKRDPSKIAIFGERIKWVMALMADLILKQKTLLLGPWSCRPMSNLVYWFQSVQMYPDKMVHITVGKKEIVESRLGQTR